MEVSAPCANLTMPPDHITGPLATSGTGLRGWRAQKPARPSRRSAHPPCCAPVPQQGIRSAQRSKSPEGFHRRTTRPSPAVASRVPAGLNAATVLGRVVDLHAPR